MKNKIELLLIIPLSLLFTSCETAGYFMDAVAGVVVGYVDKCVEAKGDQNLSESWDYVKSDYTPTNTSAYKAGVSVSQGNYRDAGVYTGSAIAQRAGIDPNITIYGESFVFNSLNGNYKEASIDATQMFGRAAGIKDMDKVCETQRSINLINQEYRKNLNAGMSQEEAMQIKNNKIGSEIGNLWYALEESHNEAQREKNKKKRELLCDGIEKRGYNKNEAFFYSSIIELSEVDLNNSSSVNDLLNMYNIAYKTPSAEGTFFDDCYTIPTPIITNDTVINAKEEPALPQPTIINEQAKAIQLIQETVLDRYDLDCTDLSDTQKASLDQISDKMNQFQDIQIVITGHTCNIGSLEINQIIGERRAQKAKQYLIKNGISEDRIQIESRNYSEPIMNNDSEEHRKQNRRVTFKTK